jgi:hypothetical protein
MNDNATTTKVSKLRENNGANKRYSLKVQPKFAAKLIKNYRNGEIDHSSEETATKRFAELVAENGGEETLKKAGIKISLYHYRMPKLVAGTDKPVSSKEMKAAIENAAKQIEAEKVEAAS